MRLQRFRVQGFKNLRRAVELDELGAVTVVTGESNVGTSNLLEAMALFFGLLGNRLRITGRLHATVDEPVPAELSWIGQPLEHIFDIETPAPIELAATVLLDAAELGEAGVAGEQALDIGLRIEPGSGGASYHVTRFGRRGSAEPLERELLDAASHVELAPADHIARLVTERAVPGGEAARYALIRTDRRVAGAHDDAGGVIPQALALALYDAKESFDRARYQRWERFAATMARFGDVLGAGRLLALFDRRTGQASLALESEHARIPLAAMGTGVQQLAAMLGHLFMSTATIIAIDHPELGLSHGLAGRLAELLGEVAAADHGPAQIVLASPAPAFRRGEHVHVMRRAEAGPEITRDTSSEAASRT